MTFEELHELASVYALGALEEAEAAEFEAHLTVCERCRRDVADFSGVVEELARADAVKPPSELRTRILDEIARTPRLVSPGTSESEPVIDLTQQRARRSQRRSDRLLLATAAAVVVVIGGVIGLLTLGEQDGAYDAVVAAADAETLRLDGDIGMITLVYSPDLDQVGVSSTDLPDPGVGKTYELWLVVDGGVTPAGLFTPVNGEVREVLRVDDIETLGFGITIEPEGGSEQPTGDILLSGTFEN